MQIDYELKAKMFLKMFEISDIEKQRKAVCDFVMNKEIPYEIRLEVYKKTPSHLQTSDEWLFHHPIIDDDEWMKYDWWNRCQEIDLVDIPSYSKWGSDDKKVKEWYTGCMDSGVWSFTFDW